MKTLEILKNRFRRFNNINNPALLSADQCWCECIPWVFNREALHLQELSQRVILAVDYVLPLFVIQLFAHDVLTQVVHHLHKSGHQITKNLPGMCITYCEPVQQAANTD